MKIIGIRASTKEVRYAILETDTAGALTWLNADNDSAENRIQFPKEAKERFAQVAFMQGEFDRVFRQSKPDRVVFKLTESMRGAFKAWALDAASFEAAIMLAAAANHIPVEERRYISLKLNSKNVEEFALAHVSRPPKLWDPHLADAVAVALKELGK